VKGIYLRSDIQHCIETNRCKKESVTSLSFSTPNATYVMSTNQENAVFWKLKASGNALLHQDIMATKKIRQSELQDNNKGFQTVTHSTCDAYLQNTYAWP
jgi:hypothetical protein